MANQEQFEKVIDRSESCLLRSEGLGLKHAVYLLRTTILEVSDRSIGECNVKALAHPGRTAVSSSGGGTRSEHGRRK